MTEDWMEALKGRVLDALAGILCCPAGEISFERVSGGNSVTTVIARGNGVGRLRQRLSASSQHSVVVRVPPLHARLPSAQDVLREYRALSSLRHQDVPVPDPIAILWSEEAKVSVLIEEFVPGVILRSDSTPNYLESLDWDDRLHLATELIQALVRLHRVPLESVTLGSPDQASIYLRRQAVRWDAQVRQSSHPATERLEQTICQLLDWLASAETGPPSVGVVHGDYDFHNVLFDDYPSFRTVRPSLRAILDWEMCTAGDVRADLAWLLCRLDPNIPVTPLTPRPSVLASLRIDEDTLRHLYESLGGPATAGMEPFIALARLKQAAIWLGHHARYQRGVRIDDRFDSFDDYRDELFEAWLERPLSQMRFHRA